MMYGELKVEIHTFLIRVLDGGEWPEWCFGHFAVMEKAFIMTGKKLSGSPSSPGCGGKGRALCPSRVPQSVTVE
jgi:hypothetical protein